MLTRPGYQAPPVHRKAGFTLIELTAAVFIITTALFGVVVTYNAGIDKLRALNESRTALRAANNEIETLRAMPEWPFDTANEADYSPFVSRTPGLDELVNATPRVTLRPRDRGLTEVTAEVRWTGEHGRTMAKSLTTLIARKGGS